MLELKTDWQGNIFIRFSAIFSPFAYTRFGIFEEIGLVNPPHIYIYLVTVATTQIHNQYCCLIVLKMFRIGSNILYEEWPC